MPSPRSAQQNNVVRETQPVGREGTFNHTQETTADISVVLFLLNVADFPELKI